MGSGARHGGMVSAPPCRNGPSSLGVDLPVAACNPATVGRVFDFGGGTMADNKLAERATQRASSLDPRADTEARRVSDRVPVGSTRASANRKVLIIDDDEAILATLGAYLESAGITVLTSNTPFGATNLLTRERPRVVLLDVDMPGLSGDALIKNILARAGIPRSEITIFFHSGQSATDLSRLTRECGLDGYIEKKGAPSEVLATVLRCLG